MAFSTAAWPSLESAITTAFFVELLQHLNGLLHSCLALLGVSDHHGVLLLLLSPDLCRFGLQALDLCNRVAELCDLGRQLRALCGGLLDPRHELLHLGRFDLPRLLVCRQLRIAEALLVGLLVRLLHELHNEVLDHLLHLREGILCGTGGDERKVAATELPRATL